MQIDEINNKVAEAELEYSAAGRIGKFIEPVLAPIGFDWKIGTALIGAFAAKEVFVAQMGIVYSCYYGICSFKCTLHGNFCHCKKRK